MDYIKIESEELGAKKLVELLSQINYKEAEVRTIRSYIDSGEKGFCDREWCIMPYSSLDTQEKLSKFVDRYFNAFREFGFAADEKTIQDACTFSVIQDFKNNTIKFLDRLDC